MSWKPLKQLRTWTTGSSKFGTKRASPLNPYTHGFWTARKVVNGIKRRKLFGGSVNSAQGYNIMSTGTYGSTGSIVGRF